MQRTLFTAAIVMMTGCSSTSVEPASAKRVTANRVYAYQVAVPGGAHWW